MEKVNKVPPGLSGEDIQAWKKAGKPNTWPPPKFHLGKPEVVITLGGKELKNTTSIEYEEKLPVEENDKKPVPKNAVIIRTPKGDQAAKNMKKIVEMASDTTPPSLEEPDPVLGFTRNLEKIEAAVIKELSPSGNLIVKSERSLFIKVYIDIAGSVMCIRGKMDPETKQCNVDRISVPLKVLEAALLAMYGKSFIRINYESAL